MSVVRDNRLQIEPPESSLAYKSGQRNPVRPRNVNDAKFVSTTHMNNNVSYRQSCFQVGIQLCVLYSTKFASVNAG